MATATARKARKGKVGSDQEFEKFSHLLQLKFSLMRMLHYCAPNERPVIRKAVSKLDSRLSQFDRYREYLIQYAHSNKKVG